MLTRTGIDVRTVTGDNLATEIAIAKRTGILRENLQCDQNSKALPKRAMKGKVFMKMVPTTATQARPHSIRRSLTQIRPVCKCWHALRPVTS